MMKKLNVLPTISIVAMSLLLLSCSQKPAEIHYASDECAHCKMMITDSRFASQMVTAKWKSIKFDAVECMLQYLREKPEQMENAKLWVSDYENPGEWLDATQAVYVQSEKIQSPMGESLLALKDRAAAEEHISQTPGTIMNWYRLLEMDLNMNMDMKMDMKMDTGMKMDAPKSVQHSQGEDQ